MEQRREDLRAADGGLAASTLITVAHRLQTIIDFDKIIVMADGAVKELGHPHDLLQDPGGVFTSLVEDTGPASAAELQATLGELRRADADLEHERAELSGGRPGRAELGRSLRGLTYRGDSATRNPRKKPNPETPGCPLIFGVKT